MSQLQVGFHLEIRHLPMDPSHQIRASSKHTSDVTTADCSAATVEYQEMFFFKNVGKGVS